MTDMTAELEHLKTTCLAQEAEIARLQAGFDELKIQLREGMADTSYCKDYFDKGWNKGIEFALDKINRITGESE